MVKFFMTGVLGFCIRRKNKEKGGGGWKKEINWTGAKASAEKKKEKPNGMEGWYPNSSLVETTAWLKAIEYTSLPVRTNP